MKKTLFMTLTFLLGMFGVVGLVKADTSKCTAEMKSNFLKSVSSANANYEFAYDDNGNVKGFNISVYNIPDNMNAIYTLNVEQFTHVCKHSAYADSAAGRYVPAGRTHRLYRRENATGLTAPAPDMLLTEYGQMQYAYLI